MSDSITTSIRLSARVRRALELRAKKEQRGKNWIINRALEHYLEQGEHDGLVSEARRQSLLASQSDDGDWSDEADLEQWK